MLDVNLATWKIIRGLVGLAQSFGPPQKRKSVQAIYNATDPDAIAYTDLQAVSGLKASAFTAANVAAFNGVKEVFWRGVVDELRKPWDDNQAQSGGNKPFPEAAFAIPAGLSGSTTVSSMYFSLAAAWRSGL